MQFHASCICIILVAAGGEKINTMKKFACLLLLITILSSCALNRTYVKDYSRQIQLIKRNFPEIYDMYCNGTVIIDNVYTYEKDGIERVRVNYHYR